MLGPGRVYVVMILLADVNNRGPDPEKPRPKKKVVLKNWLT